MQLVCPRKIVSNIFGLGQYIEVSLAALAQLKASPMGPQDEALVSLSAGSAFSLIPCRSQEKTPERVVTQQPQD